VEWILHFWPQKTCSL